MRICGRTTDRRCHRHGKRKLNAPITVTALVLCQEVGAWDVNETRLTTFRATIVLEAVALGHLLLVEGCNLGRSLSWCFGLADSSG